LTKGAPRPIVMVTDGMWRQAPVPPIRSLARPATASSRLSGTSPLHGWVFLGRASPPMAHPRSHRRPKRFLRSPGIRAPCAASRPHLDRAEKRGPAGEPRAGPSYRWWTGPFSTWVGNIGRHRPPHAARRATSPNATTPLATLPCTRHKAQDLHDGGLWPSASRFPRYHEREPRRVARRAVRLAVVSAPRDTQFVVRAPPRLRHRRRPVPLAFPAFHSSASPRHTVPLPRGRYGPPSVRARVPREGDSCLGASP
jgi:hypothetical protein